MDSKAAVENENIYKDLDEDCYQKDSAHNNISNDDGISPTHTETPSDPWFDDLDLEASFNAIDNREINSFDNGVIQGFSANNAESPLEDAAFCFEESALKEDEFCFEESALKEKEIDLYNDLISIENEQKLAKLNHENEFENLKKEVEKLKESDALKDARVSELTAENLNLKKNICSLYKTAQSEIEFKDSLLVEANRKLDNLLFRKNLQSRYDRHDRYDKQDWQDRHDRQDRYDRQDRHDKQDKHDNQDKYHKSERNAHADTKRNQSDTRTSDTDRNIDKRNFKRKRHESPNSSRLEKESDSLQKRQKTSRNQDSRSTYKSKQFTSQSSTTKQKDANSKALQVFNNHNASLQTPETVNISSLSRDSTETNNLFFNLLPEFLKQSFYEYEQSQIASLNRLKQSYITQYFNSDHSVSSQSLYSTPKTLVTSSQQNLHVTPPMNTSSLLTPSPDCRTDSTNHHAVVHQTATSCMKPQEKKKVGKVTKTTQKNIVTLFMYRQEKIPFLDKRKFGLLKNKEILPKSVM